MVRVQQPTIDASSFGVFFEGWVGVHLRKSELGLRSVASRAPNAFAGMHVTSRVASVRTSGLKLALMSTRVSFWGTWTFI